MVRPPGINGMMRVGGRRPSAVLLTHTAHALACTHERPAGMPVPIHAQPNTCACTRGSQACPGPPRTAQHACMHARPACMPGPPTRGPTRVHARAGPAGMAPNPKFLAEVAQAFPDKSAAIVVVRMLCATVGL
jgi:hypothetical protein